MTAESSRAVFLSYASQDAEAVRRICEALRAEGVEVWFDQNELRGGDAWDAKIKRQIRDCALFVPVVSANTEARLEGYFRLEWHLAEQRSLLIAKRKPFLVPVVIDATPDRDAQVPEAFLAVQWTRLTEPAALPAFVAQVKRLLSPDAALGPRSTSAIPPGLSTTPASRAGGDSLAHTVAAERTPKIPDYELLRPIGQGGYGEVWLARGVTGVYRAVKIVWRDRFRETEPYEREFRGVTESMALSLAEAGGLGLLHVGRGESDGFFYYVMELADDAVSGRTIDPERYQPLTLKELRHRRGRLPPAECVALGVELARALAGLHRRGLVHRDIKPANVILVDGAPKLADLGLVSAAAEARTYVGTEGYLPPEGAGTPAADVYAMGKVLYELATGLDRRDFPRMPEEDDATRTRRLKSPLNDVILRACASDRAHRYPDAAALLADLQAIEAGGPVAGGTGRRPLLFVGVGLAAAAVVTLGLWLGRRDPAPPASAPVAQARVPATGAAPPSAPAAVPLVPPAAVAAAAKRLLVLPLEARSADPETQFLSANLHEDIISALIRLPEMPVISTATARSIAAEKLPLPEMGRRLGVASILNGRVQRSGSLVRITLDLWRAADETSLWTSTYTREIKNGFAICDEVAEAVARILQAREVKGSWAGAQFTTKNPEAYALFARVRNLHVEKGPLPETFAEQARVLEEALKIDPEFMFAANLLSITHSYMAGGARSNPEEYLRHAAEAKRWADRASELVPGGAGDGALAVYYSMVEGNYAKGLAYAENEARALPNDANPHNRIAVNLFQAGRLHEAMESFGRALALDPLNGRMVHNIPGVVARLRRRDEFEIAKARSLHVHRGFMSPLNYTSHEYALTGVLPQEFTAKDRPVFRVFFLLAGRKYQEALALADEVLAKGMVAEVKLTDQGRIDWMLYRARALHGLKRNDEARAVALEVLPLNEKLKPPPKVPQYKYQMARLDAYLFADRKEEALAEARRLVESTSSPYEQSMRWDNEKTLAVVLARFGEIKECVDLIGRLLQVPSGLTVPFLKVDPAWDNLQSDPRFQALLADPKNSAPF